VWGGSYYQRANQYDWWGGATLNIRPASNVTVSIGPGLSGGRTPAQFVREASDSTAIDTYGVRYVFAEISRAELSTSIRVNWIFTPKLSFQLYAQPFVSAADYGNPRGLRRAGTYEFDEYTEAAGTFNATRNEIYPNGAAGDTIPLFNNSDFNFRSLRGNAVLRWEYMPGSTLFVVWQHQRDDSDGVGTFRFRYAMDRMFAHEPNNMFMVKVSYYWNP
jgi:hypothetical protein